MNYWKEFAVCLNRMPSKQPGNSSICVEISLSKHIKISKAFLAGDPKDLTVSMWKFLYKRVFTSKAKVNPWFFWICIWRPLNVKFTRNINSKFRYKRLGISLANSLTNMQNVLLYHCLTCLIFSWEFLVSKTSQMFIFIPVIRRCFDLSVYVWIVYFAKRFQKSAMRFQICITHLKTLTSGMNAPGKKKLSVPQ